MSQVKPQTKLQAAPLNINLDSTDSLSELELCVRWGRSLASLSNWRRAGRMPQHFKRGVQVRYRMSDILDFEKNSEQ